MSQDTKNTLKTPQSTKPFDKRIPFKNPFFQQKPLGSKFNSRVVTSFRTQNRGGGGK